MPTTYEPTPAVKHLLHDRLSSVPLNGVPQIPQLANDWMRERGELQAGVLKVVVAGCPCGKCGRKDRVELILVAHTPDVAPLISKVGVLAGGGLVTLATQEPDELEPAELEPVVGGFPLLDQEPSEAATDDADQRGSRQQSISVSSAQSAASLSAPAQPLPTGPEALGRLWEALVALGQVVLLGLVPGLADVPPGKAASK